MRTIEKEWEDFEKTVINEKAPAVQREEMKKGFFAGYWVMVQVVNSIGEPDVDEGYAHQFLEARKSECEKFVSEMLANYTRRN